MLMPVFFAAIVMGLLGLLVGSFLNVVIYRLPKMLELQWAQECEKLHGKESSTPPARFNLALPRSHCPSCAHTLAWYENIPVLSYLVLRGKCSACHSPIHVRYPLVELATGGLFLYCGLRWGFGPVALMWAGFCSALVALTLIDWDTTLLPDDLTLPLLWAGLVGSALGWTAVPLSAAVWGAVAGYLSLWLVFWGFKLTTGKDGMGYGDFKLFAALGAWFGWQALIPMILIASIIGAVVGIGLKFSTGLRAGGYVPFGPFLAGAGLIALVASPATLLRWLGL